MPVQFHRITYTVYTVICDSCGKFVIVDTRKETSVSNSRMAVRSAGFTLRRDGTVHCPECAETLYQISKRLNDRRHVRRYGRKS